MQSNAKKMKYLSDCGGTDKYFKQTRVWHAF